MARGWLLLLLVLVSCAEAPTSSQSAFAPSPLPVEVPMTPSPEEARPRHPAGCSDRAAACVSTERKLAWLQRDGEVVHGPVPVSLGTSDHPTPRGVFHVAWKDEKHTSNLYGIDMPFSVFFASGGIAFHEGPVDEPSHGCVHLPPAAARAFFAALDKGDRVEVF
jgi:hypothetical protein